MSIFGISWLCGSCGQDICPECYSNIAVRTKYPDLIDLILILLKTKHALCVSTQINHEHTNFIMASRFLQEELTDTVRKMQSLLDESPYYLNLQTTYFRQMDLVNSHAASSILRVPKYALRPHEFRFFLKQRLPVVITHLNNVLQLAWSPDHLVTEYGGDKCTMEDCEAQAKPITTTLAVFMDYFKRKIDSVIWKVKVIVIILV